MNTKELAQLLNCRKYGEETTKEEEKTARENNLVVVFGYSDDKMEFEGAINDEIGCYNGGIAYITKNGLVEMPECNDRELDTCPYFQEAIRKAKKIESVWSKGGYSWQYETDIPHETFDVVRDEEVFCKGIVFSLNNLGEKEY